MATLQPLHGNVLNAQGGAGGATGGGSAGGKAARVARDRTGARTHAAGATDRASDDSGSVGSSSSGLDSLRLGLGLSSIANSSMSAFSAR